MADCTNTYEPHSSLESRTKGWMNSWWKRQVGFETTMHLLGRGGCSCDCRYTSRDLQAADCCFLLASVTHTLVRKHALNAQLLRQMDGNHQLCGRNELNNSCPSIPSLPRKRLLSLAIHLLFTHSVLSPASDNFIPACTHLVSQISRLSNANGQTKGWDTQTLYPQSYPAIPTSLFMTIVEYMKVLKLIIKASQSFLKA